MITRTEIPLSTIAGISPLNMHYHLDDENEDVSSLAASIAEKGLLQPLTVKPVHIGADRPCFEVLAGRRRFHALDELYPVGSDQQHVLVTVNVFEGPDSEAALLSIMENLERVNLHPVDQYAAYVRAMETGSDEDTICRTFGLTKRHLAERLALGRLSPAVRKLWRYGEMTAECAKLFTLGSIEEQDELLTKRRWDWQRPEAIRRHFRKTEIPGTDARAIFIGTDAYIAAGGTVEATMFESFFNDEKLLDKLVDEKLQAEGDRVAAEEGWGMVLVEHRDGRPFDIPKPQYTPEERTRHNEIEKLIDDLATPEDQCDALTNEQEQIDERAAQRAIPQAARGNFAIYVFLGDDGQPIVDRGFIPPQSKAPREKETPQPSAPRKHAADAAEAGSQAASATSLPDRDVSQDRQPKRIREILDATVEAGLREAVRGRPDIAQTIAVALNIDKFAPSRGYNSPLLEAFKELTLGERLICAAAAPLADLTSALCEIMSGFAEQYAKHQPAEFARAFALRGANLTTAFSSALDYQAYFDAAPKPQIIAALEAMELPGIDKTAKKDVLASLAAREAQTRQWLPQPLAAWAATPPGSEATAEAMAEALEASDRDAETRGHIRQFIDEVIDRGAKAKRAFAKVEDVYEAFHTMGIAFDWHILKPQEFEDAMFEAGHDIAKVGDERHFMDLPLKAEILQRHKASA